MDPMDGTADRESATEVTLGARVKGKGGAVDYRAEAGVQLGTRLAGMTSRDVLAYQGDLELGVAVVDKKLRLALEGLYASGDDPASNELEGWNQLYPTAHKFLGLMDVFGGRTNVVSGVGHVVVTAIPDLKLQLDAHLLSRPEMAGAFKGFSGVEVDTVGVYTFGKGFSTLALYGIFAPSDDYPTDEAIHYLEAEVAYKF